VTDGAIVTEAPDARFLSSGDEAGTPTGDRRFRPDVQGLRAVAIALVVLFHADIPGVTGGYVGVDVFFVVSGFVITGLLLRERDGVHQTSLLSFYARRARRIIPAATLVIIVTVAATFAFLGSAVGRVTAIDGQWASVFLANFHFAASQTNYLASLQPPSPLQNFWSLAVEEQFYLVYPTIFLIVASILVRTSLRMRIGVVLSATVGASYVASILMTSANPAASYFSPVTRAWELALGGLVAVSSDALRRLPEAVAAAMTWVGLAAIVVAAFVFTSATPYPGSAVALPVLGAALIIAGGRVHPVWGAEVLLRLRPLQLLGLISYSLYLWHWPILIIAAEDRGVTSLPVWDNVLLIGLSVVVAIGTYLAVENPVRHARSLRVRPTRSVILGICLILVSLGVSSIAVANTPPPLTGAITAAAPGTYCPTPSKPEIAELRSKYLKSGGSAATSPSTPPVRMLVIGDSTACTMLDGLSAVAPTYNMKLVNAAVVGCGIVSDTLAPALEDNRNVASYTTKCERRAERAEAGGLEHGKADIVLWGSTDEGSSIVNPPSGTKVLYSGSPRWKTVMLQRMEARVRKFTATGAKVILLLEPPEAQTDNSTAEIPEDTRYENMNDLLREVATKFPDNVATVDLASRVCPTGPPCRRIVDRIGVRPDDLHYGPSGSLWVARWLIPQVLSAAQKLR
jgi:peptidoglycan/LPS O-acetylase OafA/YrhL